MITYKMHFLRTGRTTTEPLKQYVGQRDVALCAQGVDELCAMVDQLVYPQVQMVFTSPLRRCVQTADILYPNRFTEEVEGLMDMNLGSFQGRSFEELKGEPDFVAWLDDSAKNAPPGGEGTLEFTRRIVDAVGGIFHRMMEEKLTSVAVLTHGGVIMSLLAGIGLPKFPLHQWAVGNGEGYTLLFTPQMWMRDGCGEIFRRLPEAPKGNEQDKNGAYFQEESNF